MEATSSTCVVSLVGHLKKVQRRFEQLQNGKTDEEALSDSIRELPKEIKTVVDDIERKILACTDLRSQLGDASARTKIEKELSKDGDESSVLGPLRQSHALVQESEQLVDLLFKVTSFTGILGRIQSVSARGLVGQSLKTSCGQIGPVRHARERLKETLRGFEGTCLQGSVVSEPRSKATGRGGPRKGHSKNIAEAGLRREVRRPAGEQQSTPGSEREEEEIEDWTLEEKPKSAPQGEPVYVLSPESQLKTVSRVEDPAPGHSAKRAGKTNDDGQTTDEERETETSAGAESATATSSEGDEASQADQSNLWSVEEEPEASQQTAETERPAIDLVKVKAFTTALNRWSSSKALVPSEFGDLIEITRLEKQSALKVRLRGTWKRKGGTMRTKETVAIDYEGDLDRSMLVACEGKVLLSRTIRTGDSNRTAMECLSVAAPIARSEFVRNELAPFFEDSRDTRDCELLEATIAVERVPMLRAECTLECDRSVTRIYNFHVWLCGDNEQPCFSHVPKIWTAKATGYLAAICTLGIGIGYAIARFI